MLASMLSCSRPIDGHSPGREYHTGALHCSEPGAHAVFDCVGSKYEAKPGATVWQPTMKPYWLYICVQMSTPLSVVVHFPASKATKGPNCLLCTFQNSCVL